MTISQTPLTELPFAILILLGLGLFICWLSLHLLSYLLAEVLEWIDDNETTVRSPLIYFIVVKLRGFAYEENCGSNCYVVKGSHSRMTDGGTEAVLIPGVIIASLPSLIVFSIEYYPIVLTTLTVATIVFLSRFVRRQSKLFKSHVEDKNAH
jgi:hypothetical protein